MAQLTGRAFLRRILFPHFYVVHIRRAHLIIDKVFETLISNRFAQRIYLPVNINRYLLTSTSSWRNLFLPKFT